MIAGIAAILILCAELWVFWPKLTIQDQTTKEWTPLTDEELEALTRRLDDRLANRQEKENEL